MALPDFLKTIKKESFNTWKFKTLMNWYPMYFGTGGKILFWAADSTELHVRIRLNPWTYNYVGTIFGGSMFGATDPFYMLMLLRSLGKNYVVWDKTANIRFRKPAKKTLYAKFELNQDLLKEIKKEVEEKAEVTKIILMDLTDSDKNLYASIERELYIADKKYYESKKGQSQKRSLGS
jgi:acyl-coenzyme A thioesterase PaaI-like protein